MPSLRCVPNKKIFPELKEASFIAPNACIIGSIKAKENSSAWYGATVRGDLGQISIGKNTILKDLVMVIPEKDKETIIGNNVLIDSKAFVSSCTIGDWAIIGMNAKVLDGAIIEKNAVVAPGAIITKNTVVKSREVWIGNPAKCERIVSLEEMEIMREN